MEDLVKRKDRPTEVEKRIAALTIDNRDKWAENRQKFFLNNPTNRRLLNEIESAIVMFVIDDSDYDYEPVSIRAFK